jgi:hypothetical protein
VERIAAYGVRAMDYAREHRPGRPGSNCWVGSPMLRLSTPEVKAELIPSNLTPVAVFRVGYAAVTPEPVAKERPPIIWTSGTT